MKTTIFEIDVNCLSDDVEKQFASVKEKLLKVNGIESVEKVSSATSHKLLVSVSFQNAEEAKAIHGKVMNKITASRQFQVRSITTDLSDILS